MAEAESVVAALGAGGVAVLFVGGCVRDTLLDRPVRDIDIATPDPPETVLAKLTAAGIRAIPTGIAHGTVTAIAGGRHFEITTLRVDVQTDGRHAQVAFTDDWAADAERRDFTMNALFLAPDGALYDPVGGLADVSAGRVRFVGDPATRIAEDYLRVLRFFRFLAHYGPRGDQGAPDPAGLAACAEAADRLAGLSAERVAGELFRLLGAPDPVPALGWMAKAGVLAAVLPEATALPRLAGLIRVAPEADPVLRWAALVAGDRAVLAAMAGRLRLSNTDRARIVEAAASDGPAIDPAANAVARRRLLYRLGTERYRDRVLLAREAEPENDAFAAWLDLAARWAPPVLPLRGADLVAAGVAPGPEVGRLLRRIEGWWIDQDFRPDRAACLARLKAEL